MSKFKIGDRIICNKHGKDRYAPYIRDFVWFVVSENDDDFYSVSKNKESKFSDYGIYGKYFDLLDESRISIVKVECFECKAVDKVEAIDGVVCNGGKNYFCDKCKTKSRNIDAQRDITLKKISSKNRGTIKSNRTFGVELECFTKSSIEYNFASKKLHKYIGVGTDGSVSYPPPYGAGAEMRTPILSGKKGEDYLKQACKVLKRYDFETNRSCGTHCHIGIPEYDTKEGDKALRTLVLFYTVFDDAIVSLLPQYRQGASYAQKFKTCMTDVFNRNKLNEKYKLQDNFSKISYNSTDEEFCETRKKANYGGKFSRYGINFAALTEHKTIEVRYHQGTLDAKQLIHWIALHVAIIDMVLGGHVTDEDIEDYSKISTTKELLDTLLEILGTRIYKRTRDGMLKRYETYLQPVPDFPNAKPLTVADIEDEDGCYDFDGEEDEEDENWD